MKNAEITYPNEVQVFRLCLLLLFRVYIMVVRFTSMVSAGGVDGDAIGAIDNIILTPLFWSGPKEKWWLNTEEHAGEENQCKTELPGADTSSQDEL